MAKKKATSKRTTSTGRSAASKKTTKKTTKKVARKTTKKATKKTTKKASSEESSRSRRSPEQMIADLKNRIREVELKAAAKELKKSDSVRRTLGIVRNIGKALEEAEAEGNNPLRHALADAHKPLASYLEKQGMRLPKPRLPRGRKPRR